jgi:hypothetical protein
LHGKIGLHGAASIAVNRGENSKVASVCGINDAAAYYGAKNFAV